LFRPGTLHFRLRAKIFLAFVAVLVLFAAATSLVGVRYVDNLVVHEGLKRIGSYLKAAWGVYHSQIRYTEQTIDLLSRNPELKEILSGAQYLRLGAGSAPDRAALDRLASRLETMRREGGLDFLAIADNHGRVIVRGRYPYAANDYVTTRCHGSTSERRRRSSGTEVLTHDRLVVEGEGLGEQAHTEFRDTPMARERSGTAESSGMAIQACASISGSDGNPGGVVYGGILLNRNYAMVDNIKQMVFGEEEFDGRQVGTVTIFQWDLRIATNVRDLNGQRAIGTRVSSDVYDEVLEKGGSWLANAFVVNDWFISGYEPIRNPAGETIGMLYVGELLARYEAMREELVTGFLLITGAGLAAVIALAFASSRYFTRPLVQLAEAARSVGSGEFDVKVAVVKSNDEIGELTQSFKNMVEELEDRGKRLKDAYDDLMSANRDLQGTNRSYLDMLGFVSHEMRSPLATAVMALSTVEDRMKSVDSSAEVHTLELIRKKVQYVVDMAGNYLNLARIERKELPFQPRAVPLVPEIIVAVTAGFSDLIKAKGMTLVSEIPEDFAVFADPNLLSIIYSNLVSNAIKYGREGGRIVLGRKLDAEQCELNVYNEGPGIDDSDRERLFKRFSRLSSSMFTREKGTGLGLFITKAAVELQGGAIRVEGVKGAWVNFIFTIKPA